MAARAANCSRCTWPYDPSGWAQNRLPLHRITLDTSCVNARRENAALNQLEAWEAASHIRLQRGAAFMAELKGSGRIRKGQQIEQHPRVFGFGVPWSSGLGVVDDVAVTAELWALCAEWRALLEEDPPIAQQIVRKFLTERLTVERTPKGIRLTGMATFGPLMAGIVMRGAMVPPG